mgnify:CR=1 FL=1
MHGVRAGALGAGAGFRATSLPLPAHLCHPGDTRAAVTPFLAHKHFGETYKWMLYGDDDTLFYMSGASRVCCWSL